MRLPGRATGLRGVRPRLGLLPGAEELARRDPLPLRVRAPRRVCPSGAHGVLTLVTPRRDQGRGPEGARPRGRRVGVRGEAALDRMVAARADCPSLLRAAAHRPGAFGDAPDFLGSLPPLPGLLAPC